MSDMITADEADFAWPVGGYAPGGYVCKCSTCGKTHVAEKRAWQCADCVIQRLHAQLADAKAAQTMVVANAVEAIFAATVWAPDDLSEAEIRVWRAGAVAAIGACADAVKALADTDGLDLVQALRKERDYWKAYATEMSEGLNAEIADRDRLAAANAALEAQVARLVGAAEPFMRQPVLADSRALIRAVDRLRAALAEVQADARREGGE